MGNRQRAARHICIVGQHIDRLAAIGLHVRQIRLRHQICLDRIPSDQKVTVVFVVAHIGDTDAQGVHLIRVDHHCQRHGERQPVHFGVIGIAGIVEIEVLIVGGTDSVRVGGVATHLQLYLFAIDPDRDRVLIDRILVFRKFLGRKNELHRHHFAIRNETHIQIGGIIGPRASSRIKVGVVVLTAGIGGLVGPLVRLAAGIGVVIRAARRQDHPRIARRCTGGYCIAARVDCRGTTVAGIARADHRDAGAKDLFRHLIGRRRQIVVQFRRCHHCPALTHNDETDHPAH